MLGTFKGAWRSVMADSIDDGCLNIYFRAPEYFPNAGTLWADGSSPAPIFMQK